MSKQIKKNAVIATTRNEKAAILMRKFPTGNKLFMALIPQSLYLFAMTNNNDEQF